MMVGSLFSGVGGLDLGLARAGGRHSFLAEIDPWRRRVLAAHWPDVPCFDDVRAVRAGHRVDVLCGGFPCQDVSVAGRRAGLAGSRSGLFYEFARVADAVRPRWVVLENVPGLLSSNDGRDFGAVIGTLADLGYGLAWRVLDARYFGVPQRRRRVFVVGRLGAEPERALRVVCESCGWDLAPQPCSWQSAAAAPGAGADAARGFTLTGFAKWRETKPFLSARDGKDSLSLVVGTLNRGLGARGTVDADSAAGGQLVVGALSTSDGGMDDNDARVGLLLAFHQQQDPIPGERSPALGARSDGMGVSDGLAVRRLTPVECERLMSWPDGWTAPDGVPASDGRRYAACGDGVVSNVAEWLGRRIVAEDAA